MGRELWLALRRARVRPAHSLAVALTLALGIGASLAVFGAVDAILLRPLPFDNAGRLVSITQTIPVQGLPELSFSDVTFRRMRQDSRTLQGIAAFNTRDANLERNQSTDRLNVARVTRSMFSLLPVHPAIGRGFAIDEDSPGGPRVLVLTDRLWRASFNADSSVIGRIVNLEGEPYAIVGVLGATVTFPYADVDAWEPLQLDSTSVNPFRNSYSVVGRLRPRVTLEQARRDLVEPIRAAGREYPGPHPGSALDPSGYGANVRPLATVTVGDARPLVALLLGGVTALLLLTCANVVNLQLAAVIARGEELAVRVSLGATQWRLVRGAMLEGIVLTSVAATVGLVITFVGANLIASILPGGVAIQNSVFGVHSLLATVLTILVIGSVVGAVPVFVYTRRAPADALRERASGTSNAGATRMRRLLSSAQVALAVMLLQGSGLLLVSAARVQKVQLGFRPEGTLSVRINIPNATLRDRSARETLLRQLVSEVAAVPGVSAVGLANALPLTNGPRDQAMAVEGRPFKADGTDPIADFRIVSGGYFAAMGIPVVRGRTYTDDDANDRLTPLVINETLAHQLFSRGEDPIGQRLRFGPAAPWMPIVGVVADAKNRSLTDVPRPELYTPALGTWSTLALRSGITIVARTHGEARSLMAPIRRIVSVSAPGVAVTRVSPVDDLVRDARVRLVTTARLISWYAAAALLIAVAGTYAVLSYLIAQRRHELAVRVALGAPARAIVALVAKESAMLVGMGVVAGIVGAIAASRLLASLLFGVQALDPGVLGLVVAVAATAGVVAAILPVRRALGANPSDALRNTP